MTVLLAVAAWLPPPPPPPWRPDRAPTYAATCHATDVQGAFWSGTLDVTGQGDGRLLAMTLTKGDATSTILRGRSTLMVTYKVTDGTYGFIETLSSGQNAQPLAIELNGLGGAPETLVLTVRGPAKSPAFAEPAMIGLCRTTDVQPGSPFVPEPPVKKQPA